MEDDKKSSMSDKDRKMAGLFEGFGNKKEDDEEKKGKKTTKIPKRSLFLGGEVKAPKPETPATVETGSGEKKNLFSGLFKDKEIAVVESEPKTNDVVAEFSEVVVDRLQEVEKELETTTSDHEALEATADAEFLENVGERLAEGMEPETAIDDALEGVYQPPEVDARPRDLETPENFDEQAPDDEEVKGATPSPRTVTPPVSPVYNPNLMPNQPPAPNVVSSPNIVPMNDTFYRNRRTGDLLVGGTIGYLKGRNKGRNVAESRLEPEIGKLDKKVESLKQKLEESERRVREEIAKSELPEKAPVSNENSVEKLKSFDKLETNIDNIAPVSLKAEQKIVESQEQQFETQLQAMADLEIANQAIPKVENGPVTVGEVLQSKSKNQETETIESHKDVRSMTMTELLEVAEHISLEKTSLRELYERNRIDAVNLRRVIIEYMNGGSRYEQMLRGSLEAVEMQRELRGEIKRESDFSGSAMSSTNDDDATSLDAKSPVVNVQSTKADQTNSYTKSGPDKVQEDNQLLSGSSAIMLGIIAGVVVAIAFVVFTSL